MAALAPIFPPASLRYRDLELTPRAFAREVRYHDRSGALAFRITEAESLALARVVATAGPAGVMLFLFLKIVAREGSPLSAKRIADEIGGAEASDVEKLLSRLQLAGLLGREATQGGFQVRFLHA